MAEKGYPSAYGQGAAYGQSSTYGQNNTYGQGNTMGFANNAQADTNQIGQWGNFGAGLTDKVVRIKFIRKVYLILTSQLLFT